MTYVVPVVVGALGMIPKNLQNHLKTISVNDNEVGTTAEGDFVGKTQESS